MSEFNFKTIYRELPEQMLRKSFIWIWNADKVPPHIGISRGKDYFSLTYRKSEHLLTASMLKKAKRSLIPLVLIEIPESVFVSDLVSVFSKYDRAAGGLTCLHPIREVMQQEGVSQLVNLLTYLESEDLILKVNGLNLPEGYRGIPDYSMEDILKRISQLNEK
ncbi:hypothetical protein [Fluviicola chungangensis]|uniref:Uncharacterized protein n=1 Tax=Fluviicola chungangensis TaxID=2597671 RepID=A0A556N6B9_9FLAO|nr:hypothetical protein [Fluviicola chungangensis]TSJ47658.1 hypothetical protein FO442_00595 [Fluviicola chungangensis]